MNANLVRLARTWAQNATMGPPPTPTPPNPGRGESWQHWAGGDSCRQGQVQSCAKKVDGDARTWTALKLLRLKVQAEETAKVRLGVRRSRRRKDVKLVAMTCTYLEQYQAAFVPVRIVNEDSRAVTIEAAMLVVDGVGYPASPPSSSLRLTGKRWLSAPPLRLQGKDAHDGAWFFGWSGEEGGGPPIREAPRAAVELVMRVVGQRRKRRRLVFEPEVAQRGDKAAAPPQAFVPDDGSIR